MSKQAKQNNDEKDCQIVKLDEDKHAKHSVMQFLHFFDLVSMSAINKEWRIYMDSIGDVWRAECLRAWFRATRTLTISPVKINAMKSLGMKIVGIEQMCDLCRAFYKQNFSGHLCEDCKRAQTYYSRNGKASPDSIRVWMMERNASSDNVDTAILSVFIHDRLDFLESQRIKKEEEESDSE